jgi:hypothetical protein
MEVTEKSLSEKKAYQRLCVALKATAFKADTRSAGLTVADMTAQSALPLSQVKELLPRAADEYSARLAVSESGEILYSFPHSFVSRYKGFAASVKKAAGKICKGLGIAGSFLFKVWIMLMLIGYFALFLALALASVFISVAGNSKSSGRRGNPFSGGLGLFDLFIRIWFYSELTKPRHGRGYPRSARARRRPLHKAIFSFVFGDDDPNKDWQLREKKSLLAYIQANKGIISLPEFMTLTGKDSAQAEEAVITFCAEFGGSPEATEDGTIVYRFEELLLRTDRQDRSFGGFSPPIAALKKFSGNSKKMNAWFGIINTVNLIFGSYFLYNAINYGAILFTDDFRVKSFYDFTYAIFSIFSHKPGPIIGTWLGFVPLVFSLLFWLIPTLRFHLTKKKNDQIKMENLRRFAFDRIWSKPLDVTNNDIESPLAECRPKNFRNAQEKVIKEMGAYSMPEVSLDGKGQTLYSFTELRREQEALEKCRSAVRKESSQLGQIIFDSDAT